MGRPPKAPQDRHSAQLNIPLKPADYARLRAKAEKAETTITDFVRASALGKKFTVIQSNAPDFDTIEQLRRIGVNLNQIANPLQKEQLCPIVLQTSNQGYVVYGFFLAFNRSTIFFN